MNKLLKRVNELEQVSQNSGYLSCNLKENQQLASKAKRKENSRDGNKLWHNGVNVNFDWNAQFCVQKEGEEAAAEDGTKGQTQRSILMINS